MKTNKTFKDTPAPDHALIERTTDSFRRSVNGAWLPGGSITECFEVPLAVLNSTAGCGWLNPGRCGHVSVKLPDGSYLAVSGENGPIRTSGWGPLGVLIVPCQYGGEDKREEHVSQAHPLLPNLFVGYYRVAYYAPEVAATFKQNQKYLIRFVDSGGVVVETIDSGVWEVSRSFAEYVARTGLHVRQLNTTTIVDFKIEPKP